MDDGEVHSKGFPPTASNNPLKRKRNLPGNPDPEAEVIALSPKTLMATNRFLCETCGKGFQRDQNLQLHRRGHNLPWKLKQRASKEPRKRVYVCPEKTCVHNHPSRALGDLTGIKKHFCRKHGEKKWKCDKCSKRYAVQSDWKAHSKTCGTREYKCDCGTIFSRRDSFITHRAFCDALAEETARVNAASTLNHNSLGVTNIGYSSVMATNTNPLNPNMATHFPSIFKPISSPEETTNKGLSLWMGQSSQPHETVPNNANYSPFAPCSNPQPSNNNNYEMNWVFGTKLLSPNIVVNNDGASHHHLISVPSLYSSQHQTCSNSSSANMSATALLQKAAQIGVTNSADPSFLGSLGLKCQGQDGNNNKFCGVYGSSLAAENPACELSQMHPAKRRHVLQSDIQESAAGKGQTRDFLGVGVANHFATLHHSTARFNLI